MTRALFALLLIAALGCRDIPGPIALEGTYTLLRINGSPLPVGFLVEGGAEHRYTGGTLILRRDNTYAMALQYAVVQGSSSTPRELAFSGDVVRTDDVEFALTRHGMPSITGVIRDGANVIVGGDSGFFVCEFRQ